jgi:hypothetical protein
MQGTARGIPARKPLNTNGLVSMQCKGKCNTDEAVSVLM